MVHISVLSHIQNNQLAMLLSQNISRSFNLINLASKPISFYESNNPCVILSCADVPISSNIKRNILVLDNFIEQKIEINPPQHSIAIISSSNRHHRDFVLTHSLPSITYGFSSKDTVTISSNNENTVVLSLVRNVTSIFKTVIEPFDFPLKISKDTSIYNIMASFITSILIENFEKYSLI